MNMYDIMMIIKNNLSNPCFLVQVLGLVSSLVRAARTTNRRRSPLALSEVTAYLWERASVLIGRRRKRWTDGHAQRRVSVILMFLKMCLKC